MKIKHITLLTIAVLGLAACGSDGSSGSAAVEIKGTSPTSSAPSSNLTQPLGQAPNAGAPDSSGVVSYDGYQAAVARNGDTVASVANRVGLSAAELGAYNGLAPSHELRAGDELVLPPKPGGYGSQPGSAPTYDSQVYAAANPGQVSSGIEAAPLDGGAPAPAPSDNAGWSPDLAAAAIERSASPTGLDEQGNLAAPPSSTEPLPPSPQPPGELASPQLRQYQTPGAGAPQPAPSGEPLQVPVPAETLAPAPAPATEATSTPVWEAAPTTPTPEAKPVETITTPAEEAPPPEAEQQVAVATQPAAPAQPSGPVTLQLIRPVTGPIVTRFGQGTGRASSDGIDFAAAANSPVVAAAAGEVALVSQSLGGLGNIVLIRHQGEYLTVYGRIEKVTVRKGELVDQGQRIGVVSPSPKPSMHFELRRGAEGLDPERFF